MDAYFAMRIKNGALNYSDVVALYPQFKEGIDLILTRDRYEYLIIE